MSQVDGAGKHAIAEVALAGYCHILTALQAPACKLRQSWAPEQHHSSLAVFTIIDFWQGMTTGT